ncbi:hypothetical protein [Pseudoduganella sp. GCM10020061]|uniref:hypothetical protein n=1 Tax=Pseudoduganella sp. GCM10020061 TaxID=3317345 RepID=UPI00362CAA1A
MSFGVSYQPLRHRYRLLGVVLGKALVYSVGAEETGGPPRICLNTGSAAGVQRAQEITAKLVKTTEKDVFDEQEL